MRQHQRQESGAPPATSAIANALQELPALPSILRYWDDFDERYFSIKSYRDLSAFDISFNGSNVSFDLSRHDMCYQLLLKHVVWYLFSSDCRPATVANYLSYLLRPNSLEEIAELCVEPHQAKAKWVQILASPGGAERLPPLKAVLRFFCEQYLMDWTPDYLSYVQTEFPLHGKSRYDSVSSGDAFFEEDEERAIVIFFDKLSADIHAGAKFSQSFIESAAMAMCAFQFGMRPIQIAVLRCEDIKDWGPLLGDRGGVHVRFAMAKQRRSDKVLYLPRKIKHEWTPIWRALPRINDGGRDRFFDIRSSVAVVERIRTFSYKVIGIVASANVFRHSAAQRVVDAGASSEELAAFMGHASLQTGLVYYRASANQAELVNKALGLSPVYSRLSRIAHAKFISQDELAELKGDQQIGGVPHGIALSGIGGCQSGQPACPYNPVTSCYGCSRFMPVTDIGIHQNVLDEFRKVSRFFFDESRNASSSPAYMQLKRTIGSVEAIIDELRAADQ